MAAKGFYLEILHEDKKTKARYGILHTPHGDVEVPMFMPVGTLATVKTLSPEEIKSIGSGVILANTYHLHLRPGEDIVKKAGVAKGTFYLYFSFFAEFNAVPLLFLL